MFWKQDKNIFLWLPRLQCHRGYWISGKQQNSLDSIIAAYQKKFKMVEFDVRLTKDQVVILFHDDFYRDKSIEQYSFTELRVETAKEYPYLNTLKEVFEWYRSEVKSSDVKHNVQDFFKLNIELKSKKIISSQLEKKVNQLISEYQMQSNILVSSFNPFALARVRFLNSHIYRAILVSQEAGLGNHWLLKKMFLNFLCYPHVLHLRAIDWNKESFNKIRMKVPVVLWTLNDFSIPFRSCWD